MNGSLSHYGIKGMKWGVRRTPEQLGHARKIKGGTQTGGEKKKLPKPETLSTEELKDWNARLFEEERYRDFLARRKKATTSETKTAILRACNTLRDGSIDWLVGKALDRITNIDGGSYKYRDMDVDAMSPSIIAEVAKWYENAAKINSYRSK